MISGWFHKPAALISGAIILAMMAVSGWGVLHLAPGTPIAIHFGLDGTADGWVDAPMGLFVAPAIAAMVWVLFAVLPRIDTRLAQSQKSFGVVWASVTALLGIVHLASIVGLPENTFNRGRLVVVAIGALFVLIGNVLGKVRQNDFLGVRTPWTKADEWVWDQTHRFAGWIFVASGFVLMACGLWAPLATPLLHSLLFAVVLVTVLLPCVKSYLLARERRSL